MRSISGVGKINKQRRHLFLFVLLLVSLSFATIFRLGSIKKSFAVESFYVGVYWDSDCTENVTSIEWGELTPGSTRHENVFIRNEELNPSCFGCLQTEDWTPPEAADYITLSWDYDGKSIGLGEIVQVTLTLRVEQDVLGITDFGFNIVIFGTEYIVGDINHDGVVDIYDVVILAAAYGSTPSDPTWNSEADLSGDNVIDIYDVVLLARNYGISSE
jgi:hypothetical protein